MARTRRRSAIASAKSMTSSGQPIATAVEGLSKYIIADMHTKTAQGMAPEESVKRAEDELGRICST